MGYHDLIIISLNIPDLSYILFILDSFIKSLTFNYIINQIILNILLDFRFYFFTRNNFIFLIAFINYLDII